MNNFEDLLKGGSLRSLGRSNQVVELIDSQEQFDDLFRYLFHPDRTVVMRAGDVIEKVTLKHPEYLKSHAKELLDLSRKTTFIELKWHLAQLLTRLTFSEEEFVAVWDLLTSWALDKQESRIVRVNALQGLFDLLPHHQDLIQDFNLTIAEMETEPIPSLKARIRILKSKLSKKMSPNERKGHGV
ncbi:hypothetical protein [Pedobacter immunditicola]|uniref:hypothetical protein n=1 Tax=Pedobacter immunditicola TaxID=3133440 RepID=UPI00309776E1